VEYSLAAALSSLTSQSQLGGASESDDDDDDADDEQDHLQQTLELADDLFRAVQADDPVWLTSLIRRGADVEGTVNDEGRTAMEVATEDGKENTRQVLSSWQFQVRCGRPARAAGVWPPWLAACSTRRAGCDDAGWVHHRSCDPAWWPRRVGTATSQGLTPPPPLRPALFAHSICVGARRWRRRRLLMCLVGSAPQQQKMAESAKRSVARKGR
jgi:hypothetical protein